MKLALRQAAGIAPDGAARLLEMIFAHLEDARSILRVVALAAPGAGRDLSAEAALGESELGGFVDRILTALARRAAQVAAFDPVAAGADLDAFKADLDWCAETLAEIDLVLRGAASVAPAALLLPGESSLTRPQLRDPAAIVAAALDGHDQAARRTLARFCAVLGSVAGDCALVHGARTVVIAGGIVPRFVPFLRSSAFRERFLAKGRFAALLERVAIHVITHPQPGLLGAATALRAKDL